MRVAGMLFLGMLSSVAAQAAPLGIKNGKTIQMTVAGHRQPATGVAADRGFWLLSLKEGAGVLELRDVTTGTPIGRINVRIQDGVARLDPERFVAGHAYSAKLRAVVGETKDAVIYLIPSQDTAQGRVDFEDSDVARRDEELGVSEKGVL